MNIKTIITMIFAFTIAGLVLAASFPIVESISKETISIANEGAGWIRMAYDTSEDTTFNYGFDVVPDYKTSIYGPGGTLLMEGTADTILYADNNMAIWTENSTSHILGTTSSNEKVAADLTRAFNIERTAEGIKVYNQGDSLVASFNVPTWSYIPDPNGTYGYFENGTDVVKYPEDMPVATVGNFAGVLTYNNLDSVELNLEFNINDMDGHITGASWNKGENTAYNPDPMTSPNPPVVNDTSGNWTYTLSSNKATITGYTGPSGADVDITIPSTVDGHPVDKIAPASGFIGIFGNSNTYGSLTVSPGLTTIAGYALKDCKFTGTLTLPNTIRTMGGYAFQNSTFTGDLILPVGLTTMGSNVFKDCTGFNGTLFLPNTITTLDGSMFLGCSGITSLIIQDGFTKILASTFKGCSSLKGPVVIPSSITFIGNNSFGECGGDIVVLSDCVPGSTAFSNSTIKEVLNFSNTEYTTTSYGLNADEVRNDIPAAGYISITSYSKTTTKEGPVYTLVELLPLIFTAGLIIASTVLVGRRF